MKFNYSVGENAPDLLAGVTVAAISLPQAMAYALIAGVDPRFGLYSAIVVTLVASIFGSSSHLINGPTNAISLVVFSALGFFSPDARLDAYQAMFLLGIMIGSIQILIAIFKLGDLTRYISESVVIGFMAGAGTLVAITQLGNLTGLRDRGTGQQHVLYRIWLTLSAGHVNPKALGIGLGTIVLVVLLRKLARKYHLPQFDMLMALIVAALVAAAFGWSKPAHDGSTDYFGRWQRPAQSADAAYSSDSILVGEGIVGKRAGHRFSRTPGSLGDREIDCQHHAADARLQPPVSG